MDVFTVTSTKPYDQCYYELHMSNGSKTVWDDYEELRNHWMTVRGSGMSHVVVQKRPLHELAQQSRRWDSHSSIMGI